jgi:hypothetical protein
MHEVLLAAGEPDLRPVHPLISHVPVPPLSPAAVRGIDLREPVDSVIAWCQLTSGVTQAAYGGHDHGLAAVGAQDRVVNRVDLTRRASDPIGPRSEI